MKEIIVVENKAFLNKTDFVCIEDIVKDLKVEYKIEQVPENFADLLTLCKNTKGCFVLRVSDREYIEVPTDLIGYSFTFYQDGQIFADEDVCVKEKATPQQMWKIIMGLLGE